MDANQPLYTYDDVPYPNLSHTLTHPDRLATLATLLGMNPAPVERCRVLELGCAGGGNLLPMALWLPQSTFVGIDASARHIAEAQAAVQALDIHNIAFNHLDIMDITPDFGRFDYIIAHGVYSWVPAQTQDKILDICRQNLAPQGIAFVSYNTYPGWHMLEMVRRMMLYHTRNVQDPHEQAEQARSLISFLVDSLPPDSGYGSFLNAYLDLRTRQLIDLETRDDASLLHDELEFVNTPLYFHEFVERAERHGLQYLAEAEFPTVMPNRFSPEVVERLFKLSQNTIELEQYMDFLRNRTFRRTLLCHEEVAVNRTLTADRVTGLFVSSSARPVDSEEERQSSGVVRFGASDGAIFSTDHPVTVEALRYLADCAPRALLFGDLLRAACSRLNFKANERDASVLAANLLQAFCYSADLVDLHVYSAPFVVEVTERPTASPLARLQARASARSTNLRHERVELDTISRVVMQYLDGEHDRNAILDAVLKLADEKQITVRETGEQVNDPARASELLQLELDMTLRWLAKAALLVG